MSSRSAYSPSSLSAGGQDEQPWLVKSSSTAFGSAAAPAPAPATPAATMPARRLRAGMSTVTADFQCKTRPPIRRAARPKL